MSRIFLSAGHSNGKVAKDRGAIGNGYVEGDLAIELRNLVAYELRRAGEEVVIDKDEYALVETIKYFKPLVEPEDILIDFHWNSASPSATGTEVLVAANPTEKEITLAKKMAGIISDTLDIPLRGNLKGYKGVKSEADSQHKRLGFLHIGGQEILIEVCFISNKQDMEKYQKNKKILAGNIAQALLSKVYTVVAGDTLSKIAIKNGTTITKIKKDNLLNSDLITVGQKLRL